ncbi:MAG: hypothetical protein NTW14_14295, partial [bacterium]|nr:hypothetical protein [bacterium]
YYLERFKVKKQIKSVVLITLTALLLKANIACAIDISGALSGTLGPDEFTVVGQVYVLYGASLIIQPGTTFLFAGDYDFDIYGYLRSVGTETDSIIFKARQPGDSLWNGIDFLSIAADSSLMEYCQVSGSDGVGVHCSGASPTISHCLISGNESGGG